MQDDCFNKYAFLIITEYTIYYCAEIPKTIVLPNIIQENKKSKPALMNHLKIEPSFKDGGNNHSYFKIE